MNNPYFIHKLFKCIIVGKILYSYKRKCICLIFISDTYTYGNYIFIKQFLIKTNLLIV